MFVESTVGTLASLSGIFLLLAKGRFSKAQLKLYKTIVREGEKASREEKEEKKRGEKGMKKRGKLRGENREDEKGRK